MNMVFPFTAILGQDQMKQALMLNVVNPKIGGVLIEGEKGTAKSTAVRALAALLPEIAVIEGCPFSLSEKAGPSCKNCALCGTAQRLVKRPVSVVTLPLNATEDRVIGGIDFEKAVATGKRTVMPGVLAAANRGILYVDEVNLLDDHIVDVILDTAAGGQNRIEREGVAFSHPSEFVLVGTMNPEEGQLRPQLLDRFGLSVMVTSVTDRTERIETMIRREKFDNNPEDFARLYADRNKMTAQVLQAARERLRTVTISQNLRLVISDACREANVAGHRADLVIEQAARALAALEGREVVELSDVLRVAPLALAHRRREAPPPPPPPPREKEHRHEPPPDNDNQPPEDEPPPPENEAKPENGDEPPPPPQEEEEDHNEDREPPDESDQDQENPRQDVREKVFEVGETFKVKRLDVAKDRVMRRGSGRRSRTRAAGRQGRYVKSVLPRGKARDLALDATLRAAAPFQKSRKNENGLALCLKSCDMREKMREKRIGNFLLFVVDASGSMGARGRMAATKGAIMSLLLDAYQKRDKVAMITFNKNEARVSLPPTSSIETAARLLAEMPVGGRTPLTAGLIKAHEMLRGQFLREPAARPIVMLLTDGRSNVAENGGKPVEETMAVAQKMALDERVRFIVVDTEAESLVQFGLAANLARSLSASYFRVKDLAADTLVSLIKEGSNQ